MGASTLFTRRLEWFDTDAAVRRHHGTTSATYTLQVGTEEAARTEAGGPEPSARGGVAASAWDDR